MAKNKHSDRTRNSKFTPSREKKALDWLNSVRSLVEQGNTEKAQKSLSDETIRDHLAAIHNKKLSYLIRYDIASMLLILGRRAEALTYCFQANDIEQTADGLNLLALIYRSRNQNSKAIDTLLKAKELDPDNLNIWNNLGLCLIKLGKAQQSVDLFKQAVEANPNFKDAFSNLLLHLNYLPETEAAEIFEESKKWAQVHAPQTIAEQIHTNILDPNRKLRIGYISPDFREHSVMYFFDSLLLGHDRATFEIYGYGNIKQPDKVTEVAIKKFDRYRNIKGISDKDTATIIQSDKIDILVDLAGHTQNNRLGVLAFKPAPIQVTYCGYPNTTGMSQIDYRLTDAIADTPEQQQYYSEELVFLPNGFLCYNPGDIQPVVTATPVQDNNYITFGCFNNINKVNRPLMKLWINILNIVPNSKLLLKFGEAKDDQVRAHYLSIFGELGLNNAADRIIFSGYLPSPKHLELYNAVDIALDTFPYNGTTTTFQSLLMGVPVITLSGDRHASRVGLDILSRLDMQFFAAQSPEEYVKKAVALALKPDSLNKLRATMRKRLAASPLCNCTLISSDIEKAYRMMWDKYCQYRIKEKWKQKKNNTSAENTDLKIKSPKRSRGIFYVVWGNSQQAEEMLARSIASVKQYHPELPIHIERFKDGGKINKTKICDLSPFDETLYLDNDTIVLGSLDFGFEKAEQFALACCINENPWAKRYCDPRLKGDMVEYNAGVLFFSKQAKPLFDKWHELFETIDGSIFHYAHEQLSYMPVANQGSLALAIHETAFNPFVLPHNWNFRPAFHAHFSGPVKIWHVYEPVPRAVLDWNAEQAGENAVIKAISTTQIPTEQLA